MKWLTYVIGFFIIFNFPIPIFFNSLTLSLGVILLCLLFNKKMQKRFLFYLQQKSIFFLLIASFFIVLLSIYIPFFHNTFDFSLIKGNVYMLGSISIVLLFYPFVEEYIIKDGEPILNIMNYLLVLLAFQSVIQFLAFVFTPILQIVQFFQVEEIIRVTNAYGGIRGLALTGNPYFALPSLYALSYIFIFYQILERNKSNIQIIFLLLMIIGSIFSGRTAFIGLAIGLCYFVIERKSNFLNKISKILTFISISFVFSWFVFTFFTNEQTQSLITEKLLPFAFEFVYSYLESGSISTGSTDHLQSMYFPISVETFLFGDGRYTGNDGFYYMHTDAGYMRNLLFYGFFGLLFIIFTQLLYFTNLFKIKKYRLFALTIFFLLLVIHYKGEVLAYQPMLMSPIFFLTLSAIRYQKYKYTKNAFN